MFNKFRSRASALLLGLVAAFVGAPAFAQTTDVGTTVKTAIDAAGPQITLVIGSMATALVIIVAWKLIKKAFA